MGLVHFTNSAADGDRANADNWTDDVPAPLGRVPAAGDAAQMDAASTTGDLTCDSVDTNGFDFGCSAPTTITAPAVSIGVNGSAGETVGGDAADHLMTFTGDVTFVDGVTAASTLAYSHVQGNVSGYGVPANSTIDGTLDFPGKVSSSGIHTTLDGCTVGGATTATCITSGAIQNCTFQGTVTITPAATGLISTNVFKSTATVALGSGGEFSDNTFIKKATITADPAAVMSGNTFRALDLTVSSIVVSAAGEPTHWFG